MKLKKEILLDEKMKNIEKNQNEKDSVLIKGIFENFFFILKNKSIKSFFYEFIINEIKCDRILIKMMDNFLNFKDNLIKKNNNKVLNNAFKILSILSKIYGIKVIFFF